MLNIDVMTYVTVDSTSIGYTTIKAVVDMILIPVRYMRRKMLHIAQMESILFFTLNGRQHVSSSGHDSAG